MGTRLYLQGRTPVSLDLKMSFLNHAGNCHESNSQRETTGSAAEPRPRPKESKEQVSTRDAVASQHIILRVGQRILKQITTHLNYYR